MEVFVKLPSTDYEQLRSRIPAGSPATEPLEKATRIEHSVDGVLFEGYTVACDEHQARVLLEMARERFPETARKIDEAIRLAKSARS